MNFTLLTKVIRFVNDAPKTYWCEFEFAFTPFSMFEPLLSISGKLRLVLRPTLLETEFDLQFSNTDFHFGSVDEDLRGALEHVIVKPAIYITRLFDKFLSRHQAPLEAILADVMPVSEDPVPGETAPAPDVSSERRITSTDNFLPIRIESSPTGIELKNCLLAFLKQHARVRPI